MLYGKPMHNPPSRFIAEMGPTIASESVQSTPEVPAISLNTGDSVRHTHFGAGIVVEVDDDEVVVAFKRIGSKKLSLAYANLEKIGT